MLNDKASRLPACDFDSDSGVENSGEELHVPWCKNLQATDARQSIQHTTKGTEAIPFQMVCSLRRQAHEIGAQSASRPRPEGAHEMYMAKKTWLVACYSVFSPYKYSQIRHVLRHSLSHLEHACR